MPSETVAVAAGFSGVAAVVGFFLIFRDRSAGLCLLVYNGGFYRLGFRRGLRLFGFRGDLCLFGYRGGLNLLGFRGSLCLLGDLRRRNGRRRRDRFSGLFQAFFLFSRR